jgi:ABC-type polysaccharide/polyol phosphate export permease
VTESLDEILGYNWTVFEPALDALLMRLVWVVSCLTSSGAALGVVSFALIGREEL